MEFERNSSDKITKEDINNGKESSEDKLDSIKKDFLCNTILSTNCINSNDINLNLNLLDPKKKYIIESFLNTCNINFEQNFKLICNGNANQSNNGDNNNDENDNKNEEEEENDDEEVDIEIRKKKVIIKSLKLFNRDNFIDDRENFKKRFTDYNKSKHEEDNKFEKNIYIRIEDRIREYLNKYKCDKLSQLRDFENSYLLKIINFQKKSAVYKNISIKGIIIGFLNIINDFVGKEYIKITKDDTKKENLEKGEYFLDLYKKYEVMKKLSLYLEKDFISLIDNFKEEIKFEFSFDTLFTDLYWDYVFRIKELNIFFTNNYNSDKISKEVNDTMDKIVNLLFNLDLPYKKMIGHILNIACIQKEKIYLMNYIIKYKAHLLKKNDENNNNNINTNTSNNNNDNKENDNENEKDSINRGSSSCDKILNNKDNNNQSDDNNEKANEEEIKNKNSNNNEDNNSINILSEDLSTNDFNNINNNSISNDNDDKKTDLNLGKSLSMDVCSNKLSDKDSLEKVYNYILYGENENDKKSQKRKHKKKRKKNKTNNSLIIENDDNEEQIDPIVEEYKNYINNINNSCQEYVKKIKPNIKEDWINSIGN